jgi:hypothetical protein
MNSAYEKPGDRSPQKGIVHLRGMQTLVRLPIHRGTPDRRAGLKIPSFLIGYPGSSPARYDRLKWAVRYSRTDNVLHDPSKNKDS